MVIYAAQCPTLKARAGQHSVHADVSTNEKERAERDDAHISLVLTGLHR